MFRVGGIYPDEVGIEWEVISLDGPEHFPVVCKTANSNALRSYSKTGMSLNHPNLLSARVMWAVLWANNSVGVFSERPDVKLPKAIAVTKVEFTHGRFDD